MRLIGAIAAGETMETDELNDAFVAFNQMIESWNTEGASLPGRRLMVVNLVAGKNWYDLPTRPIQIVAASSSISGADSPIELVDASGFEAVQEKGLSSIYIKKLFCNYLWELPTIFIWPTPRAAGTIEMYILQPILEFPTLADPIALPPGYEAGLRFALAVLLAPEYGRPLDQAVVAQAQNFKASLVQLNTINQMKSPPPQPIPPPASVAS